MINPHFSDFIAGAGAVYNRRGYDMLISVVDGKNEADTYRALKRNGRVDGVIVHGPGSKDERPELLREIGLPFVVHGRTADPEDSYFWVDVNNRRAFMKATEHLVALGHTRIALINGFEHMAFAQRRREGFEAALDKAGIAPDPALMVSDEMIEPTAYAAMQKFLRDGQPPSAVMCASVLSALGALRAIREYRFASGRDIALISYDDCLSFLDPGPGGMGMTVIRSGIREAGEHCAAMLIDVIEGVETQRSTLLEAELIVGATTAAVRAA